MELIVLIVQFGGNSRRVWANLNVTKAQDTTVIAGNLEGKIRPLLFAHQQFSLNVQTQLMASIELATQLQPLRAYRQLSPFMFSGLRARSEHYIISRESFDHRY